MADGVFGIKSIAEFPSQGPIFTLKSTESVNEAFHKLVTSHLLSAPVYDEASKKYLGFFDVLDALILAYSIDIVSTSLPSSILRKPAEDSTGTATVGDIFGEDGELHESCSRWVPVSPETPVAEVLRILAEDGVRRVPVIDASGNLVNIISQSAVVRVLDKVLQKAATTDENLEKLLQQTPDQNGVGVKSVLSVSVDAPARDAFTALLENNISAVGILDEAGGLFSCISTKDIRLLPNLDDSILRKVESELTLRSLTSPSLMDMSCVDFVAAIRQSEHHVSSERPPLVSVHPDSNFHLIISRLAKTGLHRVFIVDDNRKPVGVVSLSDIIKMLLP